MFVRYLIEYLFKCLDNEAKLKSLFWTLVLQSVVIHSEVLNLLAVVKSTLKMSLEPLCHTRIETAFTHRIYDNLIGNKFENSS